MNQIPRTKSGIIRARVVLMCTLIMASSASAVLEYTAVGVVVCPNGDPVAGAEVYANDCQGDRLETLDGEPYMAVTASDGIYSLSLPGSAEEFSLEIVVDGESYPTDCMNKNTAGVDVPPVIVYSPDCPEFDDCQPCEGKVTALTLQYTGPSGVIIEVAQKKGDPIQFGTEDNPINQNELLEVSGEMFNSKDGTLGTEISLYVDGVLNTKIHTSCSQPIGPGMVFGDFTVVAGYSRDGGLLCPEGDTCGCEGKVTVLTFEYLGDTEAYIEVFQKKSDDPIFQGVVGINPDTGEGTNEFTVTGNDKKGTLGTEIEIIIDGGYPIKLHTSCSQPIGAGMPVGDLLVIKKGYSLKGGMLCEIEPPDGECGCEGKVTELTLAYLGSESALITVCQKKDKQVVFHDTVQPGHAFDIEGADKDGTLGTEIEIKVNGTLNTKIHTSCSQPIGPGLISGSFEVLAGRSRKGGVLCDVDQPQNGDCGCEGKVTHLTLQYNGSQAGYVTVFPKKSADPVFEGAVAPGASFSFSGTDKDGTLGTEISVWVGDCENARIHTSCSQPIGPGLVRGDFTVMAGTSLRGGELCDIDNWPDKKKKKPRDDDDDDDDDKRSKKSKKYDDDDDDDKRSKKSKKYKDDDDDDKKSKKPKKSKWSKLGDLFKKKKK